jgi:hypothetical protein
VSLTETLSKLFRFAPKGETVPADWLIYYIQTSLSIKVPARPFRVSVCQTSFSFSPVFQARANYMLWLFSVKGIFETRLKLVLFTSVPNFCLPVSDSEGQLYADSPKSQALFVHFGTF